MLTKRRLALLDQALSSITNFTASIFAARSLELDSFGVFALLTAGLLLIMGATRSVFSQVSIVRTEQIELARRYRYVAIDSVLVAALLACTLSIPFIWLVADQSRIAVALAAISIALMVWQDSVRVVAIGYGQPIVAVISDAVWLACLIACLSYLTTSGDATAWTTMSTWGLSSLPALAIGLFLLRWRPSFRRSFRSAWRQRRLSGAFFTDWLLQSGSAQVATYSIGAIGGLGAIAGIRAALLALGPLNILITGMQLAAFPSSVALRDRSVPAMVHSLERLSALLGGLSFLYGAVLFLAPQTWLSVLLGEQTSSAHQYLLPLSLYLAATALALGGHVGLRVLETGKYLVLTRTVTTAVYLSLGGLALAVTHSAVGGQWGLALGSLLAAAIWTRALRRASASPQQSAW